MRFARLAAAMSAALLFSAYLALSSTYARADTQLDRGAYLMHSIVACGNCHTPKGPDGHALPDQELSGGVVVDAPVFHTVSPNITPDKDTGIGKWTDAQIIDSIRNGKRPDGTTIGPPMPIFFYRNISDTDVRAIVAYLRSVKPIHHAVESSTFKIPLPPSYGPPVTHVADPPHGDRLAYGHYLSNIAHCMECHTPMAGPGLDLSRIGAGGRQLDAFPSGEVISANLTPANPDGIAHWTNAQVKTAITTGVRPDGRRLVLLMAFDWYRNIKSADLDALVVYLRSLKPAKP